VHRGIIFIAAAAFFWLIDSLTIIYIMRLHYMPRFHDDEDGFRSKQLVTRISDESHSFSVNRVFTRWSKHEANVLIIHVHDVCS